MNRPIGKPSKRPSKGYVLGRGNFAKISAVDGTHTTAGMDADFLEFEKKGLSADERRAVIRKKYGGVR